MLRPHMAELLTKKALQVAGRIVSEDIRMFSPEMLEEFLKWLFNLIIILGSSK